MSSASRVDYQLSEGVATITLDDGKVNVMSLAMMADIDAAFERARDDGAIVVLRSRRPGIFSAGFDLKVFAANDPAASLAMVRAGAELALRILAHPYPCVAVLQGHAYPMGAFLTLGCDVRLGVTGRHRIGLNEVAIGIAPPGFAVELARSRLQPAWLSRTVALGEMFEPADALTAGFLDRLVEPADCEAALAQVITALRGLHLPSHALAKQRLHAATVERMRRAIEGELTPEAYLASATRRSAVVLPGRVAEAAG